MLNIDSLCNMMTEKQKEKRGLSFFGAVLKINILNLISPPTFNLAYLHNNNVKNVSADSGFSCLN